MPADPRELDIHEDQGGALLLRETHVIFASLSHDCPVALDLRRICHELQAIRIVFNDENQLVRHDAPVW